MPQFHIDVVFDSGHFVPSGEGGQALLLGGRQASALFGVPFQLSQINAFVGVGYLQYFAAESR